MAFGDLVEHRPHYHQRFYSHAHRRLRYELGKITAAAGRRVCSPSEMKHSLFRKRWTPWRIPPFSNGNRTCRKPKQPAAIPRLRPASLNLALRTGREQTLRNDNEESQLSLFTAISTLIERRVHRIPIIDPVTHNFLFLITHKRILKFLYLYVSPEFPGFTDCMPIVLDLRSTPTKFYSSNIRRPENWNLH